MTKAQLEGRVAWLKRELGITWDRARVDAAEARKEIEELRERLEKGTAPLKEAIDERDYLLADFADLIEKRAGSFLALTAEEFEAMQAYAHLESQP